ncbi:hypothetical protein UFOVP806_13 [uncultured Caudovirales phage]|uniref:Uncharacterized protein n=1 Tax=uncultured Caudovirales phage TaxID=2100421 RepID=A0A6J5P784_9CAUD|nr:hypothetical protein UFOVP806_13 [uncultured Caudovirales phage]
MTEYESSLRDQVAALVAPELLKKAFTAPYNSTVQMHDFDIEDAAGAITTECFVFADIWLESRKQKTHITPPSPSHE